MRDHRDNAGGVRRRERMSEVDNCCVSLERERAAIKRTGEGREIERAK